MRKGLLFVVSGPSGVGKSTILKEVFNRRENLVFSVSVTTRKPRPGETDGVHYHFISDEKYDALLREDLLLEHAEFGGNRYGTPSRPIFDWLSKGIDVILDIESVGMRNIKRRIPEAVTIFIAPPDWDTLESRLRGRGTETEEQIRKRLEGAKRELAAAPEYMYKIVNNDAEKAVCELMELMDRLHLEY